MSRCARVLGALLLASCQFPQPGDVPPDGPPTDAAIDAVPLDAAPTGFGGFAATGTLVAGRVGAAAAAVADRVYVLGGVACATCAAVVRDPAGVTASVERAAVTVAGPGGFALAGELVRPRAGLATFRITRGGGDWLYAVGGWNDTGLPLEVERAAIAADGTLGPWTDVAGVTLDRGRAELQVLVTADHVYLIGGWGGGATYLATVAGATIDGTGGLSAFALVDGVALTAPRAAMAAIGDGAVTLIAGGRDAAGTATATVERATVSAGVLTGFATSPALTRPRAGAAAFALAGRAWVLGGGSPATATALDSIEASQLNPPGPFVANSRRLDQPRFGAAAVLLPAHACLLGGSTETTAAGAIAVVACAPLQ